MEVLDVAEEDEELLRLVIEDELGAHSVTDMQYIKEQQLLVIHFEDEAVLENAIAKSVFSIDENHIYEVRRHISGGQQSEQSDKPRRNCPQRDSDGTPSSSSNAKAVVEMMIPGKKVGILIGKNGETIKKLKIFTKCDMHIVQGSRSHSAAAKPLRITGDPALVEAARALVQECVDAENFSKIHNMEGLDEKRADHLVEGNQKSDLTGETDCQATERQGAGLGAALKKRDNHKTPRLPGIGEGTHRHQEATTLAVPKDKCGSIIGKGGETIRNLCSKTGAHIQVQRRPSPYGDKSIFDIRGNPEQVAQAVTLMCEKAGLPVPESHSATRMELLFGESESDVGTTRTCGIMVTGIPPDVTRKCLEIYFRDRSKSGGGSISSLIYLRGHGKAQAMFADPSAAGRVASKQDHLLRGVSVSVRLTTNLSEIDADYSREKIANSQHKYHVVVRSVPIAMSRYILELRILKELRVSDVTVDLNPSTGIALIQCQAESDVQKILVGAGKFSEGMTMEACGSIYNASLFGPLVVLVDNISLETSKEALWFWLKLAVGRFPHTILYSTDEEKAVGLFTDGGADIDSLQAFATENHLDDCALHIRILRQTAKVQLHSRNSPLTKTSLQQYLDFARRHGKTCVTTVDLDEVRGCARIVFDSPHTAAEALSWPMSSAMDRSIWVVPYFDELGFVTKECIHSFGGIAEALRMADVTGASSQLIVTGFSDEVDDNLLKNFFSNKAVSGGGIIKTFVSFDGCAVIVFTDPKASLAVQKKYQTSGLWLCNCHLIVSVKTCATIPHPEKSSLLAKNFGEASADTLKYLMSAVCDAAVTNLEFLQCQHGELCIVVVFEQPIEFRRVFAKLMLVRLNGLTLDIEQVPVCRSVLVKNVPSNGLTEHVREAFCSDSRHVISCEKKSTGDWIVTFSDPKHVNEVLTETVWYDNVPLSAAANQDWVAVKMVKKGRPELQLDFVPPRVVRHVLEKHREDFDNFLQTFGCACNVVKDHAAVVFSVLPLDPRYHTLSRQWPRAKKAFETYFSNFSTTSVYIASALWNDIERVSHLANLRSNIVRDGIDVTVSDDGDAATDGKVVHVTGAKSSAEVVKCTLLSTMESAREELELQKARTTHLETGLSAWSVELLAVSGFQHRLETHHKGLRLELSAARGEVTFVGLLPDIKSALTSMSDTIKRSAEESIPIMVATAAFALKESVRGRIDRRLAASNLDTKVTWSVTPAVTPKSAFISVRAVGLTAVKAAVAAIAAEVDERTLFLGSSEASVVKTPDWARAVDLMVNKLDGNLVIATNRSFSADRLELLVVCRSAESDGVIDELRSLIRKKAVKREYLEMHPIVLKYLLGPLRESLVDFEKSQAHNLLKVAFSVVPAQTSRLQFEGNVDGVTEMKSEVARLMSQSGLIACRYDLTTPGGAKYFADSANEGALEGIGRATHTSISVCGEKDFFKQYVVEEEERSEFELPNGRAALVVNKLDMAMVDCDVIVCSATERLKHLCDVSKAAMDAAGGKIREECDMYILKHGELSEGDVMASKPGRLPCKMILHVVGPKWRGGSHSETEQLAAAVLSCLHLADEAGHKSIALPALGSRDLGYPMERSAAVMVQSVQRFLLSCKSLKKFMFVDMADDSVKLFRAAIVRTCKTVFPLDGKWKVPLFTKVEKSTVQTVPLNVSGNKIPVADVQSGDVLPLHLSSLTVHLVRGSLIDQQVDAVFNPVPKNLDLKAGQVSKALLLRAGQELQYKLLEQRPQGMKSGDVVSTPGYGLGFRYVFHGCCATWGEKASDQIMKQVILKTLAKADRRHLSSVALPAVGSGQLGYPADVTAQVLYEAVQEFSAGIRSGSVKTVLLVIYNVETFAAFNKVHSLMAGVISLSSLQGRGVEVKTVTLSKYGSAGVGGRNTSDGATACTSAAKAVCFTVCGVKDSDIIEAMRLINDHSQQNLIVMTIDEPKEVINSLAESEVEDIVEYGYKMGVAISLVNKGQDGISLKSLDNESLLTVAQNTVEMLLSQHVAKVKDEAVGRIVQWQYLNELGHWCDYSPSLNRKLEETQTAKGHVVNYKSKYGEYVVDLLKRKDYLESDGRGAVDVRRKELSQGKSYPPDWSSNESYDEVILDRTSQEYQTVVTAFMSSIQQKTFVIKVTRIQNPPLWQQYVAQRKRTEDSMSASAVQSRLLCERQLWHGAPQQVIGSICRGGFNRSYCGKNATTFGQGVYFAQKASYASQTAYSAPATDGHKYVIYSQVLTGEFEVGSPTVRVPNCKPGHSIARYESTVDSLSNPSIFVTYHDAQAYPVYVIEFL